MVSLAAKIIPCIIRLNTSKFVSSPYNTSFYRSNTFPNATEPPLYQQQPPLYQQQPPLYQQQHPQAQQYNYGTTPQYPNQGNYFSGANLPPVQDFYDTFR